MCVGEGKGLPFLQGKAEFGEIYPKPVKYCSKPLKIAQEGDILISVRTPVGDVNIAPFKCAIGRGLASIKPISIERLFLFYLLIFSKGRIENEGTGSTFKAIRKHNLESFLIPLPPLEEQKQIAHILSSVDKKIEIEQRKKQLLKDPDIVIDNGNLVLVILEDEAFVKKIFFQDGMVVLQSLNPKYPPITVPARKLKMYIVGKVVGLHRQY